MVSVHNYNMMFLLHQFLDPKPRLRQDAEAPLWIKNHNL